MSNYFRLLRLFGIYSFPLQVKKKKNTCGKGCYDIMQWSTNDTEIKTKSLFVFYYWCFTHLNVEYKRQNENK